MPQDSDLAEAFRRAEQRLRRVLLGDGMTVPGVVKGEEARAQVTTTLRQMREMFTQALADRAGHDTPAEMRSPQLQEELRHRATQAASPGQIGEDRLLTPAEAAEQLGVSVSSVYRAIRSGQIEGVRLRGGTLRVPVSELGRMRAAPR